MMKVTVFAKKRQTDDGKTFYNYITRMTKKNGEDLVASVKFPEDDTPKANECPLNIEFEKSDANLAHGTYTKESTGEVFNTHTLWVKKFKRSADKYVDTSLDEF